MIVLGVDPGVANTGYGVVRGEGSRLLSVQHGVIETHKSTPLAERLQEIYSDTLDLIDRFDADAVAVEDLYFGQNVSSALAVGQARGVVLLAAAQKAIPVRSYTPQQVKGAVCGSGRAKKDQVGNMVARLLGLAAVPKPDHAADALAVAIADLNRAPLADAVAYATGARA
jgi:crossover junction endodeoxyribonuclease RuvC